jgi:hypothetical protein
MSILDNGKQRLLQYLSEGTGERVVNWERVSQGDVICFLLNRMSPGCVNLRQVTDGVDRFARVGNWRLAAKAMRQLKIGFAYDEVKLVMADQPELSRLVLAIRRWETRNLDEPLEPPAPDEEITSDHWDAILFMDNAISEDTPLAELVRNPRLGLYLRSGAPIAGPFPANNAREALAVPAALASLLIEALSPRAPFPFQLVKRFPAPVVVPLRLPIQLPVVFQTKNPRTTTLSFFDTARISAAATKDHVSRILDNISALGLLTATLAGVDSRSFGDVIAEFSDELGVVVVYTADAADPALETFTATVRVLKSHWSRDLEQDARHGLTRAFDQSVARVCAVCKNYFSQLDGPTCPRSRHRGVQEEVEPGLLEIIEVDEDTGESYPVVKWSCCGEVVADEPGCVPLPPVNHTIGPNEPTPDLKFRDEAVSGLL